MATNMIYRKYENMPWDDLIAQALKLIPVTLAVALGVGLGLWYFLRYLREENKLMSEEEQHIRDEQDADRDALVATLKNQNEALQKEIDNKSNMIQNLLQINAAYKKRIGIMTEIDYDTTGSDLTNESDKKT
jgi:uncharacterized protein HemX